MTDNDFVGKLQGIADVILILAKILESQPATRSALYSRINEKTEEVARITPTPGRVDFLRQLQTDLGLVP